MFSKSTSHSLLNRLSKLDRDFATIRDLEHNWPPPVVNGKSLYRQFREHLTGLCRNAICACCASIVHESSQIHRVSSYYPPLSRLQVEPTQVPYDIRCGVPHLDNCHILLQTEGVFHGPQSASVNLCGSCITELDNDRMPNRALANFRWLGNPPPELQGLTWIEERLIARAHISGIILRIQRCSNNSYLGLKGHAVVFPQDTRQLLDLLPLPRNQLPDIARVVWTGKTAPTSAELESKLSVRTAKVYDALQWLCTHNEDYRDVAINHDEFARWPPVFIVSELMDNMGYISDNVVEEMSRAGVAPDVALDAEEGAESDEIHMSGILDVNNIDRSPNAITLERLASMTSEHVISVVAGSRLKSQWDDPTYFTSAFPTLFPYGCGKHLDDRRRKHLPLHLWVSLLLNHCSRYRASNHGVLLNFIDGFKHMRSSSFSLSMLLVVSTALHSLTFKPKAVTGPTLQTC